MESGRTERLILSIQKETRCDLLTCLHNSRVEVIKKRRYSLRGRSEKRKLKVIDIYEQCSSVP